MKTHKDEWSPDREKWMQTPESVGPIQSAKGVIAAAMENTFDDQAGLEYRFGLGPEGETYTTFEEFYRGVLSTARDGLENLQTLNVSEKWRSAWTWLHQEIQNPHPHKWGESWVEWEKRFSDNQKKSDGWNATE